MVGSKSFKTGQLLVSLLPYLADDVGIALHVGAQDERLGVHLGQADALWCEHCGGLWSTEVEHCGRLAYIPLRPSCNLVVT